MRYFFLDLYTRGFSVNQAVGTQFFSGVCFACRCLKPRTCVTSACLACQSTSSDFRSESPLPAAGCQLAGGRRRGWPAPGAEPPPTNPTAAGGAVAVLRSFRVARTKRKIMRRGRRTEDEFRSWKRPPSSILTS